MFMTHYRTHHPAATVRSVEFTGNAPSDVMLLMIKPENDAAPMRQLLSNPDLKRIISETVTPQGTLIVSRGAQSQQQMLQLLAAHNEVLEAQREQKKFNPWKWRGYSSFLGQSLQLVSGFKSGADRSALVGFASLNLVANVINIMFGAQEKEDPHQLRHLKTTLNQQLAPYVNATALPNPEDKLADTYVDKAAPKKSMGSKAYDLTSKYSVSFGEIFLRTLGSVSLAFPITQWSAAFKTLKETKSASQTYGALRNSNPVTYGVGLLMLLGKFTSFASKEPDPFNPKPMGVIDVFREKIAFRLSSIIEGGAATWMAHDCFKNRTIHIGGKQRPDYFGGAGNVVFIGGYGVRLAAPYGTREVNMKELYAHAATALAAAPPEKLPDLLAQTAVSLKQHFHNKPIETATIYQELSRRLQQHRPHIIDKKKADAPQDALATTPAAQDQKTPRSSIISDSRNTAQLLQPARSMLAH
jgi:hypothetical protein